VPLWCQGCLSRKPILDAWLESFGATEFKCRRPRCRTEGIPDLYLRSDNSKTTGYHFLTDQIAVSRTKAGIRLIDRNGERDGEICIDLADLHRFSGDRERMQALVQLATPDAVIDVDDSWLAPLSNGGP
jgi:hypothetical protein